MPANPYRTILVRGIFNLRYNDAFSRAVNSTKLDAFAKRDRHESAEEAALRAYPLKYVWPQANLLSLL